MQIETINIVWISLFVAIGIGCGIALGFYISRRKNAARAEYLADWDQELKQTRIELQRLAYQESTSKIHQQTNESSPNEPNLNAVIQRKNEEMNVYRQEVEIEMDFLREEIQALTDELNSFGTPTVTHRGPVEAGLFEDITVEEHKEQEETEEQEETVQQAEPPEQQEEQQEVQNSDVELNEADEASNALGSSYTHVSASFDYNWIEEESDLFPLGIGSELPKFQSMSDFITFDSEPISDTARPSESIATPEPSPQDGHNKNAIREMVQLSADQFDLLCDLGFSSPTKLAAMGPTEIVRLSEIFRIDPEVIKNTWITQSKAMIGRS